MVVLKADHEKFMQLFEDIDEAECIEDAGLTQVLAGTLTCFRFVETERNRELVKGLKLV